MPLTSAYPPPPPPKPKHLTIKKEEEEKEIFNFKSLKSKFINLESKNNNNNNNNKIKKNLLKLKKNYFINLYKETDLNLKELFKEKNLIALSAEPSTTSSSSLNLINFLLPNQMELELLSIIESTNKEEKKMIKSNS